MKKSTTQIQDKILEEKKSVKYINQIKENLLFDTLPHYLAFYSLRRWEKWKRFLMQSYSSKKG